MELTLEPISNSYLGAHGSQAKINKKKAALAQTQSKNIGILHRVTTVQKYIRRWLAKKVLLRLMGRKLIKKKKFLNTGQRLIENIKKVGGKYYHTRLYEKSDGAFYTIIIQLVNMFDMKDNQKIIFNQEDHRLLNTHSTALPEYLMSILDLNSDGEPYLKLPSKPAWSSVSEGRQNTQMLQSGMNPADLVPSLFAPLGITSQNQGSKEFLEKYNVGNEKLLSKKDKFGNTTVH
jgi:hypothetical protein